MEVVAVEVPGGLAQLGEHLLCKQGVVGSIPSTSTIILIHTVARYKRKSVQATSCACDLGLIIAINKAVFVL